MRVLELFGLPKAAGEGWPYAEVPRICTRELGTVETFPQRKHALQDALCECEKTGNLKIVIFYGRGDHRTTLWSEVVRLGAGVHWRVKVPLWRSFPPGTESNCVVATRGGEQLEVNG